MSPAEGKIRGTDHREFPLMAMNRVQFEPGLSMAEFMERYGS